MESFLQLIGVLLIFVFVLAITYFTTRWMAGIQKGRTNNKNLKILESIGVGNGNLVGITTKVFDSIAKAVKGFLDVRTPVHFIKLVLPLLPVIGITQLFTGRGKSKRTALVKRGKMCQIFPFEFIPQDFRADKKI